MEGLVQKVGDVEYIFYKQLGGDMIRLDVFKGKKISDVKEYKEFDVVDSYHNGDRITYYIKPSSKKKDLYTDTTGITYKTSSMYVYTDENGNYRTFSDDTRKHLEHEEKSLAFTLECIEKAEMLGADQNELAMYRRWKADSEKIIAKYKKDLMRGL